MDAGDAQRDVDHGAPIVPLWRRKTADDERQDRRALLWARLNPVRPILIGLVCGALGGLAGFLGMIGKADAAWAARWGLASGILFSGASVLTAYALQAGRMLPPPERVRMGICDRCFRLTLDGTLDSCACGGRFEDVDGWTLNRCLTCGYDLRATHGRRCPECGAEPKPPAREAADS